MGLTTVVEPAVEPVTLADATVHLRIPDTREDSRLPDILASVRQEAESLCGRQFITATFDLTLDAFPAWIDVPKPPLQSVTSITYVDTAGATQTLATSAYTVDTKHARARIVPAYGTVWPTVRDQINAVTVRFVAGYGNAGTACPAWVRHAIKLLLEDAFYGPEFAKKARERALSMLAARKLREVQRVYNRVVD